MDFIMKKFLTLLLLIQLLTTNIFASNASLLFYGNCTACHMDNAKISAPKFWEIKENYKRAYPIKRDFIKAMSVWVNDPEEESSIMHQAVKQYKLMPKLYYNLNVLEEIAAYIYETDFKN